MNISTMYIIQRKADGLFYKNGSGYYSKPNSAWSERLSDCRPFKTIGGAKTSSGWDSWKTTLTADACEVCQNAKYHNRYEHTFSERYNNARWRRGAPETIQSWITKNGRKPCFITSRYSDEENPRRIVPVSMQLALE